MQFWPCSAGHTIDRIRVRGVWLGDQEQVLDKVRAGGHVSGPQEERGAPMLVPDLLLTGSPRGGQRLYLAAAEVGLVPEAGAAPVPQELLPPLPVRPGPGPPLEGVEVTPVLAHSN
jgi:hypothetical protein